MSDAEHIAKAEAALQALSLTYTTAAHAPVMTAEEHKAWHASSGASGVLAKNLFMKDTKNKKLLLVVIANERKVDLKKLGVSLVRVPL